MILDKKRKTPKPLILLVSSVFLLARHVGFEPTTFTNEDPKYNIAKLYMILDKKRKTPKPLILLVSSVFLLARHVGFEPTTFTTFVYFSMAESVFLLARHVGFEPTTFTTFVYFSMAESSGVAVGVACRLFIRSRALFVA